MLSNCFISFDWLLVAFSFHCFTTSLSLILLWHVECLLAVCRTKSKVTYRISIRSWLSARWMPFRHSQAKPRADTEDHLWLWQNVQDCSLWCCLLWTPCIPLSHLYCSYMVRLWINSLHFNNWIVSTILYNSTSSFTPLQYMMENFFWTLILFMYIIHSDRFWDSVELFQLNLLFRPKLSSSELHWIVKFQHMISKAPRFTCPSLK